MRFPGSNRRLVLRYAVSALIAVAPLGILFGPVQQRSYQYKWDSASDGPNRTLLLIDAEPRQFELQVACKTTQSNDEFLEVFSSGGDYEQSRALKLVMSRRGAKLETKNPDVHGQTVNLFLPITARPCSIRVAYDSISRELELSSAFATVRQNFQYPRPFEVNGLHLSTAPDDIRAQAVVVSEPLSVHRPGRLNLLGIIASLVVALGAIGRVLSNANWSGLRRVRPSLTEIIVIVAVLATPIFDLPRYDDGWWRSMARNLGQTGQSSQYFVGNLENPIGLSHLWLSEIADFIVGARAPLFLSMFCYVLMWIIIRRDILPRYFGENMSKFVERLALLAYLSFVFAWMSTLRPEPFVATLFVLALSISNRPTRSGDEWSEFSRRILLTVIAGVAINTHILGLMCVVPIVSLVVEDIRQRRSTRTFKILWLWATCGLFGIGWIFIGSNFYRTKKALDLFNDLLGWQAPGGHNLGPLDEIRRWSVFQTFATQPQRVALIITTFAIFGFVLTTFKRPSTSQSKQLRRLSVICFLGLLPLLLTTSKLHWHLGVTLPIATIGIACLAKQVESTPSRYRFLIGVVSIAVTAYCMRWASQIFWRPNHYAPFALQFTRLDIGDGLISHFLGSRSSLLAWSILFVIVVLPVCLNRRFHSRTLMSCLFLMIFSSAIAQFAPTAMDWYTATRKEAWSWSGQQFDQLFLNSGRCGAPDYALIEGEPISSIFASKTETVATPPWLQPTSNCAALPRIENGVWVLPTYVYGPLDLDQRRFLSEVGLEQLTCYVECFSKVIPRFKPLSLESASWS